MKTRTNTGMKTLVILTLTAMMALGVGTALAQGPGYGSGNGSGNGPGKGYGHGGGRGFGDGEFGPGHRLEMMAERLELTDEQIEAIKGIHTLSQEKNMELRKEMMRLRNELEGEMLKDEPSEKSALDLTGKIGALQTEMKSNRLKNRLEVRRQLTPEQRDKMLMMRERLQGREGRRGGGWSRGPHGDGDFDGPGYGKGHKGARGSW